ncbi:phosphoribosylformylglycinamidine synthase subunit PurQ [Pacificispira sp.]|uniref:phosphoribosylformylglycinamidine synthase subunit PurQ n=1 Tax=Pacificispira sp. TaxID=2888761 RepID=UPI003BABA694
MKAAIVVFPGTNRERDMAAALEKAAGHNSKPDLIWHGETELKGYDLIVVPGGFSYGDYLRCGAMAGNSPILRSIKEQAERGVTVLGVCNGFQILTETGLLPGVLMRNAGLKFICKMTHIRCERRVAPFTGGMAEGQVSRVAVAHNEGNYFADEDTLNRLEGDDRVLFRYCDDRGNVSDKTNLNGSQRNIAGILNEKGNVLGMMPHPENAIDPIAGGVDGLPLFESLAKAVVERA